MSVLDSALAQWRLWRSAGIDVELAVNLSAGDLLDGSLPAGVQKLLERWSVPAERLTLEVTESTVIADSRGAGEVLARLSALGVRLSIDDFGTGYSSMSYLRTLPVNEVKIDRSFVTTLDTDDRDRLIVSSVVDLAHRLGLRAVAEGAESVRTLDELELLGCDLVQGFQLARPMPAADVEAWMNARELPVPKAAAVGEPVVLPRLEVA